MAMKAVVDDAQQRLCSFRLLFGASGPRRPFERDIAGFALPWLVALLFSRNRSVSGSAVQKLSGCALGTRAARSRALLLDVLFFRRCPL